LLAIQQYGNATMNLLITTKTVDENDQLLGFFIEWIRLFSKKFEKVTVFCLEKSGFNLPENVEVLSLGKDKGHSKIRQLYTLYFLLSTRRREYDAVFVHMNPIWMIAGGMLWKLLGKRSFFWYTSGGVTFQLRWAEKFADTIFTASPESFRLKSNKVIVTGHGIDTELFKPSNRPKLEPEKLKILSVGRIAPVKNYEILVDACKLLKGWNINFQVTMIGEPALEEDKTYEKDLKSKIKSLGLESCFKFLGKVGHDDLPRYYQSHDLFIHLSKTGSLDKTMLEAISCGMKILSSSDAARAFMSTGLFLFENNPMDLADKIVIIAKQQANPDLRNYVIENHNLYKLIDKISEMIMS